MKSGAIKYKERIRKQITRQLKEQGELTVQEIYPKMSEEIGFEKTLKTIIEMHDDGLVVKRYDKKGMAKYRLIKKKYNVQFSEDDGGETTLYNVIFRDYSLYNINLYKEDGSEITIPVNKIIKIY